jgi:hypothetical protein
VADLARRLVRLGVCESREQAIALVVVLVDCWPDVDLGFDIPGDVRLADLMPDAVWPS